LLINRLSTTAGLNFYHQNPQSAIIFPKKDIQQQLNIFLAHLESHFLSLYNLQLPVCTLPALFFKQFAIFGQAFLKLLQIVFKVHLFQG
jgi:hypothetical protein